MLLTTQAISRLLVNAYPKRGLLNGFLIRWRPFICPFNQLIPLIPSRGPVLEVGCGIGLMTVLLATMGVVQRLMGIDVSQKAIDIARGASCPTTSNVSFECIAEDDSLPEGFDTVLCIDVLHHVPRKDQRSFVKKLAHVNPGKTIILKDVSPKPLWKALASHIHDLILSRQRISIRNENEVRQWLKDEGLSLVEDRRLDTLWYSHYVLVAEKKE